MNRTPLYLHLALLFSCLFLTTQSAFAVWTGEWYAKDPYPDYAASGVPDFDQHLGNWGKVPGIMDPSDPENNPTNESWLWTWDGPVAWANSLWWMDSRFESHFNPHPIPPPTISDSFGLVTAAVFHDDHDPKNVRFVVGELGQLFLTDGMPWCSWNGTQVTDMLAGLQTKLDMQNLSKRSHPAGSVYFVTGKREYPAFYEIAREVIRCEDVVLLLGFYQETELGSGQYLRVGGHYVTVPAVNDRQKKLRICDPFLDVANPAGGDHTDAAIVSHDEYTAKDLTPLGCNLLIPEATWKTLASNFRGVNPTGLPPIFVTSPRMGYLTIVEYMIHLSPEWDDDLYQKPRYTDYAPSGVPDFDQRQDNWGKVPGLPSPDDPGNNPNNKSWRWTWCAPVALANSLWWMDSKMEELVLAEEGLHPIPPPDVFDHFPLVRSYGKWDDHDAQNVQPFVADLAKRMKVDGDPWCKWIGTMPTALYDAVLGYLKEKGLLYIEGGDQPDGIYFEAELTPHPSFEEVTKQVYRCQDVILLLGFYQFTAEGKYSRMAGHYVTCAGVDRRGSRIKLCDPIIDTFMPALNASGKDQPLQPTIAEDHNNAAIVSHDEYHAATLSDGEFWLTDYPWSLGPQHDLFHLLLQNLEGANLSELPPLDILHSCEYITKVEYMLHVSPVTWYKKPPHHDYAQAGVPDFSQKQDKWGKNPQAKSPGDPINNPETPGWKWTWCGPAAVANSLWWMDSQFETLMTPVGAAPIKPPTISDHFPLVSAYLDGIDDHHAANVMPLVEELSNYMLTDGDPWCAWEGTRVEEMVEGIRKYLDAKGLGPNTTLYKFWFDVGLTKDPDLLRDIAVQLRRCEDVILLLGFYRFEEGFYSRVGGHFVTAAGVSEKERLIALSDPWFDTVAGDNGPSGPGRFGIAHDPVEHPPNQHNDADFLSHDVYSVGVLSDKENYLPEYPWSSDPGAREILDMNFSGANTPKAGPLLPDIQPVGTFLTKIEFMIHVSPVGKPVAVPRVTPQQVSCNQTVTFDGSASYHTNPARSIVQYEWDFDGDGVYDATGPVVSYAYPKFGIYHGNLRVTDDDTPVGFPADSFFDIFVTIGNDAPIADPGGPYVIDIGQNLQLDGSGSSDPNAACGDSIVSYEWDLNNDGAFDDAFGDMPVVPWPVIESLNLKIYPETNTIALRVKDTLGVIDTEMVSLTLYDNRPIASFTAIPNPAQVGQEVTFDASGSSHGRPDRSIVSYEWDLDGDLFIDATKKIVGHAYLAAGTYNVTLTVTDNNVPAKTASHSMVVKILPAVPPEEIAVGLGAAGRGWFEMVDASNFILTHNVWRQVPAWLGETRPALGDFDGDGYREVVVGLGGGGGGRLALFDDRTTGYAFLRWLRIPWRAYNARNGETWPACGDVDGDGKDEIVVGLATGGGGWFHIFNDASTGYMSMGWRRVPWPWYCAVNGETRPAVGDIDGDGKDELVIGLGKFPPSGGWFCMFDDGLFGFPFRGWRRVPDAAYNAANGETWPVTGDIDGDVREETVLGLGAYPRNGGLIAFFDDPIAARFLGWVRLPWMGYNRFNGETHPATANLDRDALAELVVGLGSGGRGRMWIADDWPSGVASRGWYQIPWPAYAWAQGLSYPRAKSLLPASPEGGEVPAQDGSSSPPEPHETFVGSISGNVSSGGGPVEDAWVTAYSETWTPVLSANTDPSGHYLIEGLQPGAYFVEASAETNLAPEYYDDVPALPSQRGLATPVNVYPAIQTPGIDFDLPVGGTISGLVAASGLPPAFPIPGAVVTAYVEGGSWAPVGQAETGADGRYNLEGLAAGTYYLEATPPTREYMGEYYDDVPAIPSNQSKATPVVVDASQNIEGKNFFLERGGSISGTVTDDASDTPLEGATVTLYVSEGGEWQSVDSTFSAANGGYEFPGLPPATYYLEANHQPGGYAGEYYDNIPALLVNRSSATPIVLALNGTQTGKDFTLLKGGTIEGVVVEDTMLPVVIPVEGAVVTVYEEDWGAVVGQTVTDASGIYTVGNLPFGRYYVSADGRSVGYAAEYHNNQPMTEAGKAGATLVLVTEWALPPVVNFMLTKLTSISGAVADDGLPPNPIPNAIVKAFDKSASDSVAGSATTGADGKYRIFLERGDYYVGAEAAGYAGEYYLERKEIEEAQVVSPAPMAPVLGVNFTLSPVGFIQVVSDVQFAPFSLTSPGSPSIVENTGEDRLYESEEVKPGTWTITWGAVAGFTPPPPEWRYVHMEEVSLFFGDYTLEEAFGSRVHKVFSTGAGDQQRFHMEWYGEVGKMYELEALDDLGGPSPWDKSSPMLYKSGIGGPMSYDELMGGFRKKFFRLRIY